MDRVDGKINKAVTRLHLVLPGIQHTYGSISEKSHK